MRQLRTDKTKGFPKNNPTLQKYCTEIAKLKKSGKSEADKTPEEHVNDNLLFVVAVAKQYQYFGIF